MTTATMMIMTTDRAVVSSPSPARIFLMWSKAKCRAANAAAAPGETAASDNDGDGGNDTSAAKALQPGLTLLPGVMLAAILAAVGLM